MKENMQKRMGYGWQICRKNFLQYQQEKRWEEKVRDFRERQLKYRTDAESEIWEEVDIKMKKKEFYSQLFTLSTELSTAELQDRIRNFPLLHSVFHTS